MNQNTSSMTPAEIAAAAHAADPTRGTRITRAAKLLAKLPRGSAIAAMLAECRILGKCGLNVRTRMHDTRIAAAEGGGADISVDVSFALAAPKDGPLTPLEYRRVQLTGRVKPDETLTVTHQVQMLGMARRTWLHDLAAQA